MLVTPERMPSENPDGGTESARIRAHGALQKRLLTRVRLLERALLVRLSELLPRLRSPSLQLGDKSESISQESDFW